MVQAQRSLALSMKRRFPRLAEFVRGLRPSQRRLRREFEGRSTRDVFQKIYHGRYWTNDESRSGGGSTLAATAPLLESLPALFRELGVRSVLDAPCGDFHWMSKVDHSMLASYVGADIVPEIVERLDAAHADGRRRFMVLDLIEDELPDTDLMFCRDCFIHLSNEQVRRALANVRRSGIRWLLTTTYPEVDFNPDVFTGGVRTLNLERPPFALPAPQRIIEDPGARQGGRRVLGLWSRDQLG